MMKWVAMSAILNLRYSCFLLISVFILSLSSSGVSAAEKPNDVPTTDIIMGETNAPVTIVEYAAMTCDHCRVFHQNVLPILKKRYIDTGKAKYVMRPFPLNNVDLAASMLTYCVSSENYYPMIDALFSEQDTLKVSKNLTQDLFRIAKSYGLNEEKFNKCLTNTETATKIHEGRTKAFKELNVASTPTIFVNGKMLANGYIKDVYVEDGRLKKGRPPSGSFGAYIPKPLSSLEAVVKAIEDQL